jgi:hypothetical protein
LIKTAFGRIDIKKSWIKALRRVGISDSHFHDTRHQFYTEPHAWVPLTSHWWRNGLHHFVLLTPVIPTAMFESQKISQQISERIFQGFDAE